MGSRPIQVPDWEPYRHIVKLRFPASELNEINRLWVEHGVSRTLLLRRAVEYGLPPAVHSLDVAASAAMSLRTGRPTRRPPSLRIASPPIHDPDWEPYRHVVKLRFAASELNELNGLCVEHGVSRALLLRRAIECGLPSAVYSLDVAHSAGISLRTGRRTRRRASLRKGPRTLQPVTAVFFPEAPGQRLNRRSVRYPVPEEP